MIVCPKCGTELSDTAKFCRKCGTKIEVEDPAKKEEKPVFEEPVESEDGSVEFDWDQPVDIEEAKAAEKEEPKSESETEPDAGSETEPELESEAEREETYEWGPPTGGGIDEDDDSMMPVAFAGRESAIEEVGKDGYGYAGKGVIPPWDHTREFDQEDISENKVMAMAAYILGPIGVIIALLAAQASPYVGFHVRQGLKITILEAVISLVMILLCWTLVVPAACAIFLMILMVLRIIAFVSVCKGRAIEPPIIRSMKFLR